VSIGRLSQAAVADEHVLYPQSELSLLCWESTGSVTRTVSPSV
jgi:hypothetical protein